MPKQFKIKMYGYTLNPLSIRKDIREDLIQNIGIKALNGEKGKKGELIIFPTKKWSKRKIISYLKERHNNWAPGIGYYGFEEVKE